jgi:PAS domain S-box-containing protein
MSKRIGRPDHAQSDASDTGFEALQSTTEFRGPIERLDGHEDTDHFALIYEDRAEQMATVVPFVRQGIERGERCMYIVDDDSRDELVAALRDGGVDVDAALDAGQLSIHSVEETYLDGGEFDADEARDLLRSAIEEALDEYEGFRVTAEETWLVNDEAAQREFMNCEAHVNDLVEDENAMALCQYNRAELPPEVVEGVIETHPYLVYDGTACPNDYYTPPEEYFGPDRPARENERKLETLVDRTDARASLQTREYYEREMYEITSDPERSFEEKLDALFDLGCEWFDLDLGGLAKVDPDDDYFEVERVSGDHDHLVPGKQADLSETYCRVAADRGSRDALGDPVAVTDPVGDGFEGKLCYEQFGVRTYLGSYLEFEEASDRTFWFVSNTPREDEFSEAERTFHHLMGQWVQYELERRQRERKLFEREQHLSALIETTPECIKTVADDGTLLQMNPAGLDMVEADSESDVTGECVYDLIAREDRERFREFNERVCRGERGTLEFDIVGLDGTRRHMETHAAPLHRPDGTTVQVALTRDVTEQVEREQRLEETVAKLEDKNDRLENFASMLAHELRNPVTIGQIYSQQLPDDTDVDAVEYVTEALDRVEDIIDVMLVLTRGQDAVGERTPVDLAATARDAWADVDAPEAALDVEVERTIQADGTYIRHLFQNLLENAVEHGSTSNRPSDDDAVEYGSTSPRSHAHEDAVEHAADVTVTVGDLPTGFYVEDDGVGIPADERDAIFDEGYTTASDNGGTGLGLAFVQKLTEVYGWDCTVTESAAGGARFEFRNVT